MRWLARRIRVGVSLRLGRFAAAQQASPAFYLPIDVTMFSIFSYPWDAACAMP